jgi:uncharacterized membrane protein
MGKMSYGYFFSYNVFGGIVWVVLFTLLGFFFGNIPFVKANFELVIIAIILISVVPQSGSTRGEMKAERASKSVSEETPRRLFFTGEAFG